MARSVHPSIKEMGKFADFMKYNSRKLDFNWFAKGDPLQRVYPIKPERKTND